MNTTRRQFVAGSACFAAAAAPASVRIVQPHGATALELLAAHELKEALERIFPERRFTVTATNRIEGPSIVVGTLGKMPLLDKIGAVQWAAEQKVPEPEGYIVKSFRVGRQPVVAIGGSGERGTLYGVYSFLEELGCGFYLSYEIYGRSAADLFSDWSIADAPAVSDRAVLNWHNFPSSCSTWNLEDWKTYIDRTARMKFNCLAVHLYGNNPILAYTHNGVRKPIEGLTTSLRGREWGTQNVIDVRRMIGAEGIFREPVFGSRAAMVPDERRAEAAASLMREVFAYARSRGMDALLAIDLDTESALPLSIVETLPASALIRGRNGHPIPNPDEEAGYAFYRSQVRYVVENYPAVNRIVLWSRAINTPASQVPPAALPAAWSADFEARFSRQGLPSGQREFAAGYFVMNRMARAVRRALDELGRREIGMGFGTWLVRSLNTADPMFDSQFAFYSLDGLNLPREATRSMMRSWTPGRKVLSFEYGQNDDGEYAGRCTTPIENLADLLHASGGGFGILHWTWRPMDLVFASHARQVWRRTHNEPLRQTCDEMAARTFGPAARKDAGSYLEDWVRHAPEFGRETLDFFADPDWFTEERCAQAVQASRRRSEDLARWRPLVTSRTGGNWWDYFAAWEEYARRFFLSGRNLTLARRAYERGDLAETTRLLNEQPVERMIEQYASTMRALPATPGEKALLLSMNARWYPYFLMMRQLAGADPIRFRFAKYEPSPLAQQPGRGLFYFDEERRLWYGFLVAERSRTAIVFPRYFELSDGQCGFTTASPVDLQIGIPMDYWHFSNPKAARLRGNTPMTNGDYTIQLHFVEPDSLKPGERLFHVDLQGRRVLESLDLAAEDPGRRGLRKEFPVRVEDGFVRLKLTPLRGEAVLCGFVLLPRQLLSGGAGALACAGSPDPAGLALLQPNFPAAGFRQNR